MSIFLMNTDAQLLKKIPYRTETRRAMWRTASPSRTSVQESFCICFKSQCIFPFLPASPQLSYPLLLPLCPSLYDHGCHLSTFHLFQMYTFEYVYKSPHISPLIFFLQFYISLCLSLSLDVSVKVSFFPLLFLSLFL